MAKLIRYAPVGHPYFDKTLPYHKIFAARFEKLGSFSPEIAKPLKTK